METVEKSCDFIGHLYVKNMRHAPGTKSHRINLVASQDLYSKNNTPYDLDEMSPGKPHRCIICIHSTT